VEVSSIEFSKGRAIDSFLVDNNYSVILCIGDDTTDESMFKLPQKNLIKVKVGSGDTNATYRIANADQVLDFLNRISN